MSMANKPPIAVRGAGITGLWQALTLARRGFPVTLYERSVQPFADAASLFAGAMLAPFCEAESAEPVIRELGLRGLALWQEHYPGTVSRGTLVVAHPRDRSLLDRFARLTGHAEALDVYAIQAIEPALGSRFQMGLLYPGEAHLAPQPAMAFLLDQAKAAGALVRFGAAELPGEDGLTIDCRGMGAKTELPDLRGVRGERIVLHSKEVVLTRPVRLLHPRFSLYIVPWGDGNYMVGATAIESEEAGAITLRSALELMNAAYALDPAFGEAEIVAQGAGVRPAFPDNRPRIMLAPRYIYVNGLYRHGFLLAPVLAELIADYLDTGATHPEIFVADSSQRRNAFD
jgi:glycine oxidase